MSYQAVYAKKPSVFMRMEPSELSMVTSEVRYGEEVLLGKREGDWVLVTTKVDGYSGWIKDPENTDSAFVQGSSDLFSHKLVRTARLKAHIYHVPDTEYGPILSLPFGSLLPVLKEPESYGLRWIQIGLMDGRIAYVQRGDIQEKWNKLSPGESVEFSKNFMGLPYTWGGRSSFGFDCSGFVQFLFQERGIFLPRDSKDQIHWSGFVEVDFSHLEPEDLIFWGADRNKIRHVGMYIGDKQFIHSGVKELSPYIKVSNLSSKDWVGSDLLPFKAARRLKNVSI